MEKRCSPPATRIMRPRLRRYIQAIQPASSSRQRSRAGCVNSQTTMARIAKGTNLRPHEADRQQIPQSLSGAMARRITVRPAWGCRDARPSPIAPARGGSGHDLISLPLANANHIRQPMTTGLLSQDPGWEGATHLDAVTRHLRRARSDEKARPENANGPPQEQGTIAGCLAFTGETGIRSCIASLHAGSVTPNGGHHGSPTCRRCDNQVSHLNGQPSP